jgi:hypothetical protein
MQQTALHRIPDETHPCTVSVKCIKVLQRNELEISNGLMEISFWSNVAKFADMKATPPSIF